MSTDVANLKPGRELDFQSRKPGRELDVAVAKAVFGHEVVATEFKRKDGTLKFVEYSIGKPSHWYDRANGNHELHNPLLEYSTDIAVAWTIVDKVASDTGLRLEIRALLEPATTGYRGYEVSFTGAGFGDPVVSKTVAHAICLAALKAMGAA